MNVYPSCQVLPETQGAESGAVVLEEPGPSKVTHLTEDITSLLLHEGKDWSLLCRAEEKSKEFFGFSICIIFQKRAQMGISSTIASPVVASFCSSKFQATALTSGKVSKGAWRFTGASRHSAMTAGVSRPVPPQPASSIPPTCHSDLHCHLSYFQAVTFTRCEKGRR